MLPRNSDEDLLEKDAREMGEQEILRLCDQLERHGWVHSPDHGLWEHVNSPYVLAIDIANGRVYRIPF